MMLRNSQFPGRKVVEGKLVFYWQSAYADAADFPYVLYSDIYELLCNYDRKINYALTKEYNSADVAIHDMLQAWQRADRNEDGTKKEPLSVKAN